MKVLSICIPTYNRVKQLKELISSLLSVKSDDFEVVVTNNCSTDNTLDMLNSINDDRLVIYTNASPEPAFYNMIVSIFNANGKYALYCNDRDVIFSERLLAFIDFLKAHEYSFLHIEKCYGNPTYKIIEFEKGFDSLIHHPYCDHPTGMVYNVDIMKNNLNKEDYKEHIQDLYTWCFLSRDLSIYEKTAKIDNYLWDERPSIFKVQSASGSVHKGKLFFDAETTTSLMKSVADHLIGNSHFVLSDEQQKKLLISIFDCFIKRIMWKKIYHSDDRECQHYGIKSRYISYFEMKDTYRDFFKECDETLKKSGHYEDLREEWDKKKRSFMFLLPKYCLGCDYSILVKKFKRAFNPSYRY